MIRLQAYRFVLQPTPAQERMLRSFAGSCRFVYNEALALQRKRQQNGEPHLGYAALCKLLTAWRNSPDTPWLAEGPAQAQQQALKDLDEACQRFVRKEAGAPGFRKKGHNDSFRFVNTEKTVHVKLEQHNNRLYLPKLGWVRYRNRKGKHRLVVEGAVKNVTVKQKGGRWFVSIQTEREVAEPVHPARTAVGIDLGVVRFATLSDGTVYEPLHSFKRHEQALRKAQQALARKVKGSRNWRKAKARVQKMHARIAHVRQDYLHKLSHAISKSHAVVCIESLHVKSMTASARGTAEAPGKNVRAKAALNKTILDQGWGEFRRQLAYKLAWRGGRLVEVPPQHTSQTCPRCGHTAAGNRPTQARFACVLCGFEANADWVAATNILSRGMQRLRDEGRDTADASAGMGIIPWVYWRSQSRQGIVPVSPDGLWIEPQGRSEAGTHRGAQQAR